MPSARGNSSGETRRPSASRCSRNKASAGTSGALKSRLCPLSAPTAGRSTQPAARSDHGPIASTTASAATASPSTTTPRTAPPSSRTSPVASPITSRAPCRSAPAHQRFGEAGGVHLGGGLGRAQPAVQRDRLREPGPRGGPPRSGPRRAAEGRHAPVAPTGARLARQRLVQREAAPRERLQRRAVAPVERQEAPRVARRRAGHARALDHRDLGAPAGEVQGAGRADGTAPTNDDPHGWAPAWPIRMGRAWARCAPRAREGRGAATRVLAPPGRRCGG